METEFALAGVGVIFTLCYLTYTLLYPEKF